MSTQAEILREIETLRGQLHHVVDATVDRCEEKVLRLSQELDRMINRYYSQAQGECPAERNL